MGLSLLRTFYFHVFVVITQTAHENEDNYTTVRKGVVRPIGLQRSCFAFNSKSHFVSEHDADSDQNRDSLNTFTHERRSPRRRG